MTMPKASNLTLKFAPFGRWDAPSARPLAARWASSVWPSELRSHYVLAQEGTVL